MDLDSSSSSLNLPVSVPPQTPLSGITPVDTSTDENQKDTKPPEAVDTPTRHTDTPVTAAAAKVKKTVVKTESVPKIKTEPVGVAVTRTSHRQIKRPKTDEELIDFESSSRSTGSKRAKSSLSKTATPSVRNSKG